MITSSALGDEGAGLSACCFPTDAYIVLVSVSPFSISKSLGKEQYTMAFFCISSTDGYRSFTYK